jgi:hypothetical protein
MYRMFAITALAVSPTLAAAANDVSIVSETLVERTVVENGKSRVVLEKLRSGQPGTRLVFQHSFRNVSARPVSNFGMTNPVPPAVRFVDADAAAVVSVDGGKTYGPLATLKVTGADGKPRAAQADDVTHVRWALKAPMAPGVSGKFSYRGVVK